METGLPNKEIFDILVAYTGRFQSEINYFAGWKVESICLEDQVLITLMKLRQDYAYLHLAKLFHCSTGTIQNIVLTFVHLLYVILYYMKNVWPQFHLATRTRPLCLAHFLYLDHAQTSVLPFLP